jgi:DNA-binding NtrC family response regulator
LLERYGIDRVIAVSLPMQRVLSQVRLASQTGVPVLLRGERGVGKESLARTIHYHSPNQSRPFVTLDCEALPPALLQPQSATRGFLAHALGHEDHARDVGVIYLREPACLPRDFQAQLGEYLDSYEKTNGPRVMAGTSVDLEQASKSGTFLERLPYQLAPLVIEVPPVRQRRPDLPYLVHQILEQGWCEGGHRASEFHPAAWEFVETYDWPGNLTELRAILGQAQRHAKGAQIQLADFPARFRTAVDLARMPDAAREPRLPLNQLLMETERRLIQLALRQAKGNISRAAARLEVSRPRLYRRMQQLGLVDTGTESPADNETLPAGQSHPHQDLGEERG